MAVIIRYDTAASDSTFAKSAKTFERRGLKLGQITGFGDQAYYFDNKAGKTHSYHRRGPEGVPAGARHGVGADQPDRRNRALRLERVRNHALAGWRRQSANWELGLMTRVPSASLVP